MSKSKRKGEKLVKTAIQLSQLGGIAGDGSKKHKRKLKKFNKTSKQFGDTLREPSRDGLLNPDNYLIGTPIKQVGVVDPALATQQQYAQQTPQAVQQPAQQMTNVPPQQANTLGNAQPVFNQSVQQAAQGIYGSIDQRQNAVNATPLFQKGYTKTTIKPPTKQYYHLDPVLDDNMKMVLEKHRRQNNQPIQEDSKILDSKFKKQKEQKILKYEKY